MTRSGVAAARYLTRLPIPGPADTLDDLRHVAIWFPIIGLGLGLLVAAVDWAVLAVVHWPVRNALIVILGVALSGAIHLDALMDSADGLAAPRDLAAGATTSSVHTPHGVVAGALAILVAWCALQGLAGPARSAWIVAAVAFGRAAIVLSYRLARPRSAAGPVTRLLHISAHSPGATGVLVALAVAAIAVLGPAVAFIIIATVVFVVSIRPIVERQVGGISGDHYGAVGAIVEPLTLLVGVFSVVGTRT